MTWYMINLICTHTGSSTMDIFFFFVTHVHGYFCYFVTHLNTFVTLCYVFVLLLINSNSKSKYNMTQNLKIMIIVYTMCYIFAAVEHFQKKDHTHFTL